MTLSRMVPILILLSSGCMNRTIIRSEPAGAAVFEQGNMLGVTPLVVADFNPVNVCRDFVLELPGFEMAMVRAQKTEWGVGRVLAYGRQRGAEYAPEYRVGLTPTVGDVDHLPVDLLPCEDPPVPEWVTAVEFVGCLLGCLCSGPNLSF